MKRFLLLFLFAVNLQVVIQNNGFSICLLTEAYAQHMTQEAGDNCYEDGYGWYFTTIPNCGVVITRYLCSYCGAAFDYGSDRSLHEKTCPQNPNVKKEEEQPSDPENNNGTGNSGGGTSGGGTSGGGTSGGGSTGGGWTSYGSHHVGSKNLIEAISKAVKSISGTGKACNLGVQQTLKNAIGSIPITGTANEMIDKLKKSSLWKNVDIDAAMKYANQGYIVIAGWKNPTGASGHVVVLVPNGQTHNSYWGGTYRQVPSCMDTGPGRRTTSQSISWSFGESKREEVKFYVYY